MPTTLGARILRDAIVPLVAVGILVALYLWVQSKQLGSIEVRNLNREKLTELTVDHIRLTLVAAAIVLLISVPLGIALTRPGLRRASPVVLALANVGQAAPVIGVLVLLVVATGRVGDGIALTSIVVYSALPVIRNTMVGLQGVDANTLDAAKGLGMSRAQVLRRVELPLAVPVILAGIRTALILIVGVTTLVTFVNAGALGDLINTGQKLQRVTILVTGAGLCAALALLVDWVAGIAERLLTPKGFRVGA